MSTFINGVEIFIGITVGGTWAAQGTWTLPAFTLNGTLTLNGQALDAGSLSLIINTTGIGHGIKMTSTQDSVAGVADEYYHNSGSPEVNDLLYKLVIYGKNDVGAKEFYHRIDYLIENVNDGTEAGKIDWYNRVAGNAWNKGMALSSAGELWVDTFVNPDDGVKVGGAQVVGVQGAAVANPTDAASTQARLTDLLGRLRTHGLIAT